MNTLRRLLEPTHTFDAEVVKGDDFSWGLAEDPERATALVNRFSELVGFSPLPSTGDFGVDHAQRAVEAYLWAIGTYMADREQERSIRSDILASVNEHGIGRFFAEHGEGILERLERAEAGIANGSLQPYRRQLLGIDTPRAAILGVAIIGAAWLYTEAR